MGIRKLSVAGTALVLVAGLIAAVVLTTGSPGMPVPRQRLWAAANQSHRVSSAVTLGRIINGRFVRGSQQAAGAMGSSGRHGSRIHPAGSPKVRFIPPPRPIRFPVRGKVTDKVRTLQPPAPAVKTGYDAKTSLRVPPRDATRETYTNADGTRTAFLYTQAVNYQRPNGTWVPISTALVPQGPVLPAAGTASATAMITVPATTPNAQSTSPSPSPSGTPSAGLSPSPSASPSLSASPSPSATPSQSGTQAPGPVPASGWAEQSEAEPETFAPYADAPGLVTVPLDGSHSVAFGIANASHVPGVAQSSSVSYADALPSAAVRFTAGTGTVKEQIVLASAAAPTTWVFPLTLTGLHAQPGPGGIVQFTNATGKVLAYVPHGFMTDSKLDPHSGDGAASDGVSYSLTTVHGHQAIQMTLDTAWLDSPARVFPVTVDPSVSPVNSDGTTYVQSPDTNDFSTDTELHVGTWDGGTHKAQSYIAFTNVASALQNDTVLGARLGLFETWSYSCQPSSVYVYPVTASWSVTGSKSWPGPSTGSAVGRASFAYGWTPAATPANPAPVSPCPARWRNVPLDQAGTVLINKWTHGTTPDNGLALGASSTDSNGWKKFASHASVTGDPYLAVTYTTDGASYKLAARKPLVEVLPGQNGKFAIQVTNTGSSTWTTSNGYEISYRAYSSGKLVADHPVFTAMPSTVAPGQTVTVDAVVNALAAGSYAIDFDMYSGATGSKPVSFSSQGIPPYAIGLNIPQPPPVISAVYPPTGFISPTLRQQLSTVASTSTGTITYSFTLTCKPLSGQTCVQATVSSGSISKSYWTPPATSMTWNTPYQWSVTTTVNGSSSTVSGISLEPEVPQPGMTSGLGATSGQAYDPLSGNYTTSATEAAVPATGIPLRITRSYNSLDPRVSGAFGAGWSSVIDMSLRPDNNGTGNSNDTTGDVVITLQDGKQVRFGENGDGKYAPPFGSHDILVHNSGGTWTLRDSADNQYTFTSGGVISKITDPNGRSLLFTVNSSSQVATVKDAVSGRSLALTWGQPSGAAYSHVYTVTTEGAASGQTGYTWNYAYSGDKLTGVCGPADSCTTAGCPAGCTAYSYQTGSHYLAGVLDSGARSYWQLGEASGTTAADEVDANLGTTDGTYQNITLGAAGPLAGSSETAATFNGTSSSVSLPANLLTDSSDVAAELWFKAASGSSGVLFSYQTDALSNPNGTSDNYDPALYIGGNGELYGEFWNGSVNPIHTSASVTDGKWHHVVLTASNASQSMYLDGAQVGSPLTGTIDQLNMGVDTIGAGFWQGWPQNTQGGTATPIGYFKGSIAQVAVYPHPLTVPDITTHYALGTTASPELTQVTLPSGNTYEATTYDTATDRLASYTDPNGGTWTIGQPLTTGYRPTSDSLGEVVDHVTVTDPASRQESYSYDMLDGGRLIEFNNGIDAPLSYGYDAAGFLTTVVNQDGDLACFTNDSHGNVLTRTWYPLEPSSLPGGGIGTIASCGGSTASDPTCVADGNPCTTFYSYAAYNSANPLDPTNGELTSVRDGRSASSTDNTYRTTYAYNSAGQLTSQTSPPTSDFPNGRTTSYTYSTGTEAGYSGGTIPAGLLLSKKTPGGATTSYQYYSDGDLAQVTDPSGRYTVYTYDPLGRPQASTVYTTSFPAGETTQYSYDALDRPVTTTYPAVSNQVTSVTHQLQDSYAYDADGNVTSFTESGLTGGDSARTTSYTYNDHDQMASQTQPAGATSAGATQSGGASSADPQGATTGYEYDAFGNVSKRIDPNHNEYRYTYNEYNESTQVTLYTPSTSQSAPTANCSAPAVQDGDGGCDLVLSSSAYDPAGLLAASTDAMGRITNYGYDNNQDLLTVQQTDPSTSPTNGRQTTYGYDGAGNLTSKSVSALTGGLIGTTTLTNYTMDAADRLTSAVADATPSGSGSSGYANRTASYTYDADGHVLSRTVGASGQGGPSVTNYTYDPSGNVLSRSVTDPGAGGPAAWFPLAQASGPAVTDSVSGGQPATGNSVNWNGSSAGFNYWQYITTGGPVVDTTGSFTVAAWVNLASTTGSSSETAVSQDAGTDSAFYLKYYPGSGGWEFMRPRTDTMNPSGATADSASTAPAAAGTWTFLTGTYDAGTGAMTLYVNGTASGGVTDATPVASSGPLAIGRGKWDGGNGDFFGGQIADVQVYPRALSAGEVSSLYGLGQGGGDVTTGSLTTTWTRDQRGLPTSMTAPDGAVTNYAYDEAGRLAVTTDPMVTTETYGGSAVTVRPVAKTGYDTFGDRTQSVDPDGNKTTSGYDGDGRVTSVLQAPYTPPGASASITQPTAYGYDENGNLAQVTDPAGKVTQYGYDALGDVTSVTEPQLPGQSAPGVWHYAYDAAGEQLSVTDPLGKTSSATYDYFGQKQTTTDQLTNTASYGYDYLGDLTKVTSPDGVVTTAAYDHLGELTSVADSYGDTTSYAYDFAGRLSQLTNPDTSSEQYGYDPAGNRTSITDYGVTPSGGTAPQLRSESFGYDLNGGRISVKDWNGNNTTGTYNAAGELTSQVVPVSASSSVTTSYGYDPAGNRTSVTGGNQNTTWTTYNSWNLPESVIKPAAASTAVADRTWTTGYDALGRPVAASQPGGITQSYGYDPLGDLTSESGTGGSAATSAQTLSYDLDGRLASATAPGGTDTFAYYDNGALKSASGPSGTSSFTYNGDGLVASETAPGGTTSYTYDSADRLHTVADPLTGSTLTYAYNPNSLPTSIAYSTGGTAGTNQAFTYDSLNRLASDTLTSSTGATLASQAYGYDNNGNLTSQATTGLAGAGTTTYAYDQANRLTSATTGGSPTSYGYDGDGNLTQAGGTSYAYNAQDQVTSATTSAGTTNYAYTLSGALASVTAPGGTAQAYTSDAFGNLVSAPGGVSYGYDALGRLVTRTSGGTTTSLSYLGTGATLASDGTSSYTYTPSGTMVAAGAGGTSYATLGNLHGDVTAVFNPAAGTSGLAGSASYGPYGTVTATAGVMPALGYQGAYTDPATGLVDMGARWYNPATGSFTSVDQISGAPLSSAIDGNPYAYTAGDPLIQTDPTGHDGPDPAILLDAAQGAASGADLASQELGQASWGRYSDTIQRYEAEMASWNEAGEPGPAEGGSPGSSEAPWTYSGGAAGGVPGGGGPYTGPWSATYGEYLTVPGQPAPGIGGNPVLGGGGNPVFQSPPLPPQDCYAGPAATCKPPEAPASLRTQQTITTRVRDIVNVRDLFKQHRGIKERLPKIRQKVKGTNPDQKADNSPSHDQANDDITGSTKPITQQGVPATPTPDNGGTITETAGNGNRGAGGGNPPTTNGTCEPGPSQSAADNFTAPETYLNRHGQLTNGTYTLDETGMAPHTTGSTTSGKSQFLSKVNADQAVLDGAAYADCAGMWVGNKAKIFIQNGPVGILGESGELTDWLNIYRTRTGFIHGAPGSAP